MRITKVFILVFAIVALLAALPCQAAEKKAYNAVATFVGQLDPGITTYSGKMAHIRGAKNLFYSDASDDRLDGYGTSVFNANFDSTDSGQIWGSYQVVNAAGDVVWEGSWQGQMYNYALGQLNWITKSVMRGKGEYEGLMIECTMSFDTDFVHYPFIGYEVGEITNNSKE
jgi:hypothetical protein